MAHLLADYVSPADLTGYARTALSDFDQNRFTLSQILPAKTINDLDYRFTRGGGGLLETATFRTYDAESPIGKRAGKVRVTGELPPISRKIRLGEYDRLKLRGLDAGIVDATYDDAETMVSQVAARLELARGEVLYTGKIILNENGVSATVDYGRAAGHTVTAGTPWSTVASADPVTDILAWQATYLAANGVRFGSMLISSAIEGYLLRNAGIRTTFASLAGSPNRVTKDQLAGLMQDYGLPPYFVYDAQVSVNGTPTSIVPANRVVFLPPGGEPLGNTFYGVTAEALELPGVAGSGSEAGIVAAQYKDVDPVAVWTKAAAIALPVLANPDLTFAATVA